MLNLLSVLNLLTIHFFTLINAESVVCADQCYEWIISLLLSMLNLLSVLSVMLTDHFFTLINAKSVVCADFINKSVLWS